MNTESTLSRTLWEYLRSLKSAMTLLPTLAVTSIIGTVIRQGNLASEYIESCDAPDGRATVQPGALALGERIRG